MAEICDEEGVKYSTADNWVRMRKRDISNDMKKQKKSSKPSVSNDNPFSESLFKTLKYCPEYPSKPFDNIEDARDWVDKFVSWYNNQHLHSGINFVTPESKHKGEDIEILNKRNIIYLEAKRKNPNRWSGKTRDWSPIESVKLNHLKKEKLSATKVELSKSC
jgi:putative transposase